MDPSSSTTPCLFCYDHRGCLELNACPFTAMKANPGPVAFPVTAKEGVLKHCVLSRPQRPFLTSLCCQFYSNMFLCDGLLLVLFSCGWSSRVVFCFICSTLVDSCFICSTLVDSCIICSALVVLSSICSALVVSSSFSSVLKATIQAWPPIPSPVCLSGC